MFADHVLEQIVDLTVANKGIIPDHMDLLDFTIRGAKGNIGLDISFEASPPDILAVDKDSLAARAGAQAGDHLFALNGVYVVSMSQDDILSVIHHQRPLTVRLLSATGTDNKTIYVGA